MLRKDYEQVRDCVVNNSTKIADRADKADLFFVICFWQSPITNNIDHRVGYFESIGEACNFSDMLVDTYKRYNFKFYIVSSVSTDVDGGLFDA